MEEVIDHNVTMSGAQAMQWAREISKLPDGCFTIAFYPCSLQRFSVDSDNFFLFTDKDGEPRMCYTILIRYMGFPQDGFKLHKIDWLS